MGGARLVQLDEDDARYILTVELQDGRFAVAVVPPFPVRTGRAGLGPLVRGAGDADPDALAVLALPEGAPIERSIVRERTPEGWQAEIGFSFSNGPRYHALYAVDLPGVPLRTARAMLLTALNLLVLLAALGLGRVLLAEPRRRASAFPG